ncbi:MULTISPECIES: PadR family transcriptional regulator [unclassified Clostridium]|jgi:transcriptional regulator, PadR family|uniref:PadR family transcriptional regulator n=1 Tax=unclassified Clostridium TaxID=2614128 RepID=UPI0025BFC00D|nr:PadR family transcriptional regulator [Clostridium sp.]MCI6693019.1 PadR family transcriptional regulator [Clostridium sp.]MDY2630222.1 PadR family transcriptional regulator [Clostridium sp.]MDY4251783.1 PadR family transcriptional regulator [Clostridium sp.]MDY6228380.1 PadR family transcriptional regulator [Clostridium sp.]
MEKRNRLVAPRNVVNTKMLYSFYILKELAKGNTIFGNKVLEEFRNTFSTTSLPFPVSSSTIYETLYDLEVKGYVTSTWTGDEFLNKRSKKIYSITDSGIEYYKNHIADYINNLNKTKATLDTMINMLK